MFEKKAGEEVKAHPLRGGHQIPARELYSFLTRDEKAAYLIACCLLCLCAGVLFRFHPWPLAFGLPGGARPFAAALALWLLLAATCLGARRRIEPGLIILQYLLAFIIAPLRGTSLPIGLLLSIPAINRTFVRQPLGDSAALLYIFFLMYLGFALAHPGLDSGGWREELAILTGGLTIGIWLSLSLRRQLTGRAEGATALRRVQAVTSELFDANVRLQDQVDQTAAEAARRERLALARELHDTVAYTFTTIAAAIETGAELIEKDPATAIRELRYARSLTTEGLREVRGVVRDLREKAERGFSGPERWAALANVFHEATGVIVTLDLPADFPQIASELDEMIYRLIQEGMINAFRHGRATVVWVRVWMESGHLCLLISDNGAGAKEVGIGFGLLGMQERVHALGGRLSWRTSAGTGFDLAVEIPFEERRAGQDDQGAPG